MGDTFDRFQPRQRGLFGDNEQAPRRNQVERVKMFDATLCLRQERELSIMVTQTDSAGEKWISLPKSMIEYQKISATIVEVQMPEALARDKGLI